MSAWTGQRGQDDQHTARQDIKDRIIGTGNHDRTASARQPGHRAAKKGVTRQLGQLVQTTGTRPDKTSVVGQPRQDSQERITGTDQPGQASLDILAWTGQVRRTGQIRQVNLFRRDRRTRPARTAKCEHKL